MKILVSHLTSNQFHRRLLQALAGRGWLAEAWTGLNCVLPAVIARCLLPGMRAELDRRRFAAELAPFIRSPQFREAGRLAAQRAGWNWLTRHESGFFSVDAAFQALDHRVARRVKSLGAGKIDAVYAYEDGALATFEAAHRLGLKCVYELPIAYWECSQRLLREEAVRLSAWEPTLGGTRDSIAKLERKTCELELADVVVCPSRFVADSLPAWAHSSKEIVIAPFGSPEGEIQDPRRKIEDRDSQNRDHPIQNPQSKIQNCSARLRVLFAGSMSQRKGLADLFAAMRLLQRSDVELVVMGTPAVALEFYRKEFPGFIHESPRPHAEVLRLMRTCDVLVLPSIVEGRALVMQEAMSQGLPLIITPNTGGNDLIDEGRTGFLVPIRSPEAIASRIAWCADHRSELKAMGRAAVEKASEVTWANYTDVILAAIEAN